MQVHISYIKIRSSRLLEGNRLNSRSAPGPRQSSSRPVPLAPSPAPGSPDASSVRTPHRAAAPKDLNRFQDFR